MKSAVKDGWAGLIPDLEANVFPEYLPKQRWFGGKSRRATARTISDEPR